MLLMSFGAYVTCKKVKGACDPSASMMSARSCICMQLQQYMQAGHPSPTPAVIQLPATQIIPPNGQQYVSTNPNAAQLFMPAQMPVQATQLYYNPHTPLVPTSQLPAILPCTYLYLIYP